MHIDNVKQKCQYSMMYTDDNDGTGGVYCYSSYLEMHGT